MELFAPAEEAAGVGEVESRSAESLEHLISHAVAAGNSRGMLASGGENVSSCTRGFGWLVAV